MNNVQREASWEPWADSGMGYSEGLARFDVRADGLSAGQAAALHDALRDTAFQHLVAAYPDARQEAEEQPPLGPIGRAFEAGAAEVRHERLGDALGKLRVTQSSDNVDELERALKAAFGDNVRFVRL